MTGRRAVAILDRGLDVLGRVQGAGGQLGHGFKIWSAKYLSEYWKFANYVALMKIAG